jgi:hypothetical protein
MREQEEAYSQEILDMLMLQPPTFLSTLIPLDENSLLGENNKEITKDFSLIGLKNSGDYNYRYLNNDMLQEIRGTRKLNCSIALFMVRYQLLLKQ